jgi:hypothetical protein
MISLDVLLDMVATEAIEGGSRDHYFDEFRNREYIPPEPERYVQPKTESKLPPIKFNLELIKNPDGSYEWVE